MSPPVAIKICGLSTAETLQAAIAGKAAYVGFVFYPPSPRAVSFDRARALAALVPQGIGRVGVFVDADNALLEEAVRSARLDVLQLHGSETPERASNVRSRFGLPVWRGLGLQTSRDVTEALRFAPAADLLLFDAKAPKPPGTQVDALPGGNGVRFDWRLLEGRAIGQRWGLSGGLDAGNVGEAIARLKPDVVDVSSGVEDAPGVKSLARIAAFIAAANGA